MPNRLVRPAAAAAGARPPDRLVGYEGGREKWVTYQFDLARGWVEQTELRAVGSGGALPVPPAPRPPKQRKVSVVCVLLPHYRDGVLAGLVKRCNYHVWDE